MDGPAKGSGSLAVNDTNIEDSPLAARGEILDDEILDFTRFERVKIQGPVDWEFHRIEFLEVFRHWIAKGVWVIRGRAAISDGEDPCA